MWSRQTCLRMSGRWNYLGYIINRISFMSGIKWRMKLVQEIERASCYKKKSKESVKINNFIFSKKVNFDSLFRHLFCRILPMNINYSMSLFSSITGFLGGSRPGVPVTFSFARHHLNDSSFHRCIFSHLGGCIRNSRSHLINNVWDDN